ncbi:MAG: DHH family phosphoesterase [Eubacterium sp.]|nr:DHH family phosphoesterase [Eubacterium sp.]
MNKVKSIGELNKILTLPLWLLVIPVAVNIGVYVINQQAGFLMTAAIVVYAIVLVARYIRKQAVLMNELITFATQYGQIQKQIMLDFSFPYALTDQSGHLLWFNNAFAELTGKDYHHYKRSITSLFPDITKDRLPDTEELAEIETEYGDKKFEVSVQGIALDSLIDSSRMLERTEEEEPVSMYALLFRDVTELRDYMRRYEEETMVLALIYLDNYDEALESVEDVRRSLLTALIDRKITRYFLDLDAVVKKFEIDKYLVFMRARSLEELKANRFQILEEVKTVNIGNDMAITLSIGVGANNGSYTANAESARSAIELALGRGGDQAVLRDGNSISYYGGKSMAVEKTTRVKARVKAHALREFIDSKEKVVVMGHQLLDIDAFGAAVGICRAAMTLNRLAHIVIDSPTSSTKPFISGFEQDTNYEKNMLVSVQEAREMVDNDTLLVVVDTNKPDYTECEELLQQTRTIVVLDHHRQSDNYIRNAVLSYIEPYASSTCEMVSEVLQYFPEEVKIRNIEADALYAGIMVDTDNFMQKTGVRTFEAAAFLRRSGADMTRVRKMFRENMDEYRVKGEVLRNVEMYREHFAISICPSADLTSPTIVASQAANQLLDINNVKASFVLTDYNHTIYISARAIDEINVQIIMEKMGGGGHLNIAGAQLPGYTIEEAREKLKQILDEMLEGGELE